MIPGCPSAATVGASNWASGLSYPFTPNIIGRANVVGGVGRGLFAAPASGLELAFKLEVFPNLELALAFNGYGDILGLRFTF